MPSDIKKYCYFYTFGPVMIYNFLLGKSGLDVGWNPLSLEAAIIMVRKNTTPAVCCI